MSAEILRRAASLMRERVEDCVDGWDQKHTPESWRQTYWVDGDYDQDAPHIASWHPTVALAVADWLEAVAIRADDLADTIGSPTVAASVVKSQVFSYRNALAVARAYLGGDA